VRKLLALTFFLVLTLSCAQPEQRVVRGGTPRGVSESKESKTGIERTSLRKFGRDWKGRYCEKTIKNIYGLSERQLETVKRELRKQKPSLATKATQGPPDLQMPQTSE